MTEKFILLVNDRSDKGEPIALFTNSPDTWRLLCDLPWCEVVYTNDNELDFEVDVLLGEVGDIVKGGMLPYEIYTEDGKRFSVSTGEPWMAFRGEVHKMSSFHSEYELYLWAQNPKDAMQKSRKMLRS